jgi:transcriptional regulator with XRE-family HTH domain
MEHDASFGRWLTHRRQSLHLQRTELAARIGCAVITLRKIEVDERRPSRQVAELLAAQLAVPAEERETFVRVARGELPVARLAPPGPVTARSPTLRPAATELVGRPEVRLLTLTGAPGVGKSRLARELAARLQHRFADGAALVSLGALNDPELVLTTIAQTLPTAVGQGCSGVISSSATCGRGSSCSCSTTSSICCRRRRSWPGSSRGRRGSPSW